MFRIEIIKVKKTFDLYVAYDGPYLLGIGPDEATVREYIERAKEEKNTLYSDEENPQEGESV